MLLHGWAKRTARKKRSTKQQIRALANYLPTASVPVYNSLGGQEALDWAQEQLKTIGYDDTPGPAEDGEIDVLGLPYYGPNQGRDSSGNYFSPMTDFLDGVIDKPAVMYTHGTQNGFSPETVGDVTQRWYDRRGGWFRVKLDPLSDRYAQLLEAHREGALKASTGAVPASFSFNPTTGHIDSWLVGELSLVDTREGWRPVNSYAITKCEIEPTLFTDYYGDPVEEGRGLVGLLEELKRVLDKWSGKTGFVPPADGVLPELADSVTKAEETPENAPDTTEAVVKCDGDEHVELVYSADVKDNEPMDETVKCAECDEAKRLADELTAELKAEQSKPRCARCPDAIRWIKNMVKAGKMTIDEALVEVQNFTVSDETFDVLKATVEARTPAGIIKAEGTQPVPFRPDMSIAGPHATGDKEPHDENFVKRMVASAKK